MTVIRITDSKSRLSTPEMMLGSDVDATNIEGVVVLLTRLTNDFLRDASNIFMDA